MATFNNNIYVKDGTVIYLKQSLSENYREHLRQAREAICDGYEFNSPAVTFKLYFDYVQKRVKVTNEDYFDLHNFGTDTPIVFLDGVEVTLHEGQPRSTDIQNILLVNTCTRLANLKFEKEYPEYA
jgi:hypothetical protein